MKNLATVTAVLVFAIAAQIVSAQELPNVAGPVEEHEWLLRFVGQWDVVSEGSTGEGQPPIHGKAVMTSSMLGKLWLVNSSEHKVAGMAMKSIQMIGYDTDRKKYVGIWVDSMVNHMWRYEGTVDEAGNKITLGTEGPSMTGDGKMTRYRDAYEFKDNDTIVATSSMQGEDGEWVVIMKGTATRRR